MSKNGLTKVWRRAKRIWTKEEKNEEMPYSLVLLLREPHIYSSSELQRAAERAWRRSFDGKADPMYFVVTKGPTSMVKIGSHVVNVLHAAQTYLDDPQATAEQLPQLDQKKAWLEHQAWAALDFWNLELPKQDAYQTLAKLSLQLADRNCSAIFLPRDEILMPNDGTAEEGLQLLSERALF
jgi:hypothetical protein